MATIKGWKFPIQVDPNTGKIQTVEDNENIKQSVKVILGTQKFERKVVPTFGTDLHSFMFEVMDPTFVSGIKNSINSALNLWEKNIRDLNVSVDASAGPVSKVDVNIDYITKLSPIQERITKKLDINGED